MSASFSCGLPVLCLDAVGTLIHPREPVAETYARAGRRHGFDIPPEIISRRFRYAFEQEEQRDRRGNLKTDEQREQARWRAIIGHVFHDQVEPLAPFEDLWSYFARPDVWECYPDAVRLLEWLRSRGGCFAVASNFDRRLRSILAGLPPLSDATEIVISSEIGWRKPATQFFEELLHRLERRPEEVIYVGDSLENDYQPAAASGLQAFWLRRSPSQAAKAQERALASLDDLRTSLTMLLNRHPGSAPCTRGYESSK